MKNNLLSIVALAILFSCVKENVIPKVDSSNVSNYEPNTGKSKDNSNARTECEICIDDLTLATCTCGGVELGSYSGVGNYYYPPRIVNICPNTTSIGVQMQSEAVPNKFKISFLDKNNQVVSTFDSNWMGYMNYPGPWLNWNPPVNAPSLKTTTAITTAQTSAWPCPWALPGTSELFRYQNPDMALFPGTPVNGVTWSILSGAASLIGNGGVNQTVNFSSSFSTVLLQATTQDPSTGGFQNCQETITIGAPILSNITSVKIEVWTSTPGPSYQVYPNQDAWRVDVTCTQNNNRCGSGCF